MLAIARAAGETAPLLFTSFGNQFATGVTDLGSPDSALPLLIFRGAGSPYAAARDRAWAGALVLISSCSSSPSSRASWPVAAGSDGRS